MKSSTKRSPEINYFLDMEARECSIRKSSATTIDGIWFGVNSGEMHLSRNQVKGLIPILQLFVDTGELT